MFKFYISRETAALRSDRNVLFKLEIQHGKTNKGEKQSFYKREQKDKE